MEIDILGKLLIFLGGILFGLSWWYVVGVLEFQYPVAPSDYIQSEQIEVYEDKIIINISNATWGSYSPTGSMIPTLNENSHGIKIVPTQNDIHLGDLITYSVNKSCGKNCSKEEWIIHRVIKIGSDEKGVYYILKGDNNKKNDNEVRFEQIKYKTIMIIY